MSSTDKHFLISKTPNLRKTAAERRHNDFLHKIGECAVSARSHPIEAAHIRFAADEFAKELTGISRKAHPQWILPLHRDQHREQHDMGCEEDYWRSKGWLPFCSTLSPLVLSAKLWKISQDVDGLPESERIILAKTEIHKHRWKVATS